MIENLDNSFIALVFRMRNIHRWSLLFNTHDENLSQHSTECAYLTHYLAAIGNEFYHKNYCIEKLTVCALFHDIPEVITGDIPTPIKYCSSETLNSFKELEKRASNKLLNHLPSEIRELYSSYINKTILSEDEIKLLKVADKLCAYIKCVIEIDMGNKEYLTVSTSILNDLKAIESEEAEYFMEHCISTLSLSMGELNTSL